jgi:hypothetical protein
LPWWGLAALIAVSACAVAAFAVLLGAGRQPDPPEADQATDDAEFNAITSQYEE